MKNEVYTVYCCAGLKKKKVFGTFRKEIDAYLSVLETDIGERRMQDTYEIVETNLINNRRKTVYPVVNV